MSNPINRYFNRHKFTFQTFLGFIAIYIAFYLLIGNWAHWKYRLGIGPEAPFGLPIGTVVNPPFLGGLILLGYTLRNRWHRLPHVTKKDQIRLSLYLLGIFLMTYLLFHLTTLIPLFKEEDSSGLVNPSITAVFANVALGVIILSGGGNDWKE
ncbi:MAG: hypothetical protein AAF694_18740 [Bacteroidota bacterium]